MVLVEVLGGAVFVVLAGVTTLMAVAGILGVLGAARLVRCELCGHLALESGADPARGCVHCRHPALFHPLHALHGSHLSHGGGAVGAT